MSGPAQAEEARAREGLHADGIALVAAEQDDVGRGLADQEADVAEGRVGGAAEHGDGAVARLVGGSPQLR